VNSEQPKSPVQLVLRVLDEPGAVFTELATRPRALLPVILYLVVAFGSTFGMPARIMRSTVEQQLQTMEQHHPGMITAEVRQRAVERAGSLASRSTAFAIAAVIGVLTIVIVAAVLRVVFGGLSPEQITFRQEFAIAAHAYVPQILGAVATLVAIIVTSDAQFRFSLGVLFDPESGGFVYKLANQFTLFGAWNVYLLALGNQIKTRTKSIATPLVIVGALWVVVGFLLAGLQSVMGGLMG
jgi:Yip1 domain